MKSIDRLVDNVAAGQGIAKAAEAVTGYTPERARRDLVDAINQAFAEFELAYHNQFHKAFAAEGSLALAKKYWLQSLQEFPAEVIRRAARHVVQTQEFLPTLAAMIAACDNAPALFGLPAAEAAYREACLAAEPKAAQHWSHPAVYYAGRETGWFVLQSEPQSVAFPQFDYHYTQLCRRVLRGETLDAPIAPALPAQPPAPLSLEQSRARLHALRSKFDL